MNLDQYMAAQRGREIETPVAVSVNGKTELHPLNRILYGPPPRETTDRLVKRMADVITRCVTTSGSCTERDLLANFTAAEIEAHAKAAWKGASLHRLGETL